MSTSCLKPITRRSAEAEALDRLRAAIISSALPPGSRLTEAALAAQMATSRATVRTALHHLVAEGLVVQVPYTGWMVASLSSRDAWELVTLRASLEVLAASLAAERATDQARAALVDSLGTLASAVKARRAAAAAEADLDFHQAIVAAAGHERLVEHYRRVSQQIKILIASSNALLPNPLALMAQHEPILRAILTKRSDKARDLIRAHIELEGAKLVTHLEAAEAAASSKESST